MFLVETKVDGRLKAGRKTIAITGRSGYVELTPGSYKISWQPEGSKDWQVCGRVEVKDIAPARYQARVVDGKVAEFRQL